MDKDSDSEEIFREGRTVATSKVQDDCEGRANKDTIPADGGQTKMDTAAERASSSQETEKMVDSTRDSVAKKTKRTTVTDGEGKSGVRKARKKTRLETLRDGAHKHSSKSARKKHHQALLKQKLKQRKRVSAARLKAYGLAL